MIRIVRWLIWLMVSLIVLTLLDQALTRVPMKVPVLEQFQTFYVDFRGRLVGIVSKPEAKPSIEEVIDKTGKSAPAPEKPQAPLYLYSDDSGELHFADRLEDIPPAYRKDAQPMEP